MKGQNISFMWINDSVVPLFKLRIISAFNLNKIYLHLILFSYIHQKQIKFLNISY